MNRWYCMDCLAEVELDTHGRCCCCESEAVDSMEPRRGLIPMISMVNTNTAGTGATA